MHAPKTSMQAPLGVPPSLCRRCNPPMCCKLSPLRGRCEPRRGCQWCANAAHTWQVPSQAQGPAMRAQGPRGMDLQPRNNLHAASHGTKSSMGHSNSHGTVQAGSKWLVHAHMRSQAGLAMHAPKTSMQAPLGVPPDLRRRCNPPMCCKLSPLSGRCEPRRGCQWCANAAHTWQAPSQARGPAMRAQGPKGMDLQPGNVPHAASHGT